MKNYDELKLNGDQDGKNEFKDILQIFLQLQDQGESRTPFTNTNLKALFTRMVPYVLAYLLHLFKWRMPEGEEIDLSDKFGIILKKSTPVNAIPLTRLSDPSLYV
ncbi:hypothetical protein MKX03_005654 [Papaver bracteatum]|nr:hypothetical protein MKX03_005654 [Papaver bracteatum]